MSLKGRRRPIRSVPCSQRAAARSPVSLTQILRKQWPECAAMDHPVTDQ